MSLEWNLHTNQQPVSESVTMNEAHVVLLDKSELPAVLKHITVFKACFQTEKELPLYSSELRAETETYHPVLVADKAVLVQHSAVPIIAIPKTVTYRNLPVVTNLSEYFHGVSVRKRMLIPQRGV